MALKEEFLAYVPEDKRAEFAEKTKAYAELTDDVAFEYVKKSQSLTDKIATPHAEARLKSWKEKDFPKELEAEREKIRAEFAPKTETPEQKELREMREWKAAQIKEKADETRKAEIRKKAHDLGLDPIKAERFYVLPDADAFIAEMAEDAKAQKAKIEELEKKIKYGTNPPPGGGGAGLVITLDDLNKMEPKAQAAFFAKGGRLE